jgi:hypothetical protein
MSARQKLVVITEGMQVVSTQVVKPPSGHEHVTATLRAGPGQQRHVVEAEVPERFSNPQEIQAFHERIAGLLGLTKK